MVSPNTLLILMISLRVLLSVWIWVATPTVAGLLLTCCVATPERKEWGRKRVHRNSRRNWFDTLHWWFDTLRWWFGTLYTDGLIHCILMVWYTALVERKWKKARVDPHSLQSHSLSFCVLVSVVSHPEKGSRPNPDQIPTKFWLLLFRIIRLSQSVGALQPQAVFIMAISRRMIISRSQSELDLPNSIYDSEDDVWFNQDRLFQVRKSSISQNQRILLSATYTNFFPPHLHRTMSLKFFKSGIKSTMKWVHINTTEVLTYLKGMPHLFLTF